MEKISYTPQSIKQRLNELGIKPSKSYGQNFLINTAIAKKIVEKSGVSREDTALEVGPGLGIMSQELIPRVKKYIGIEKDGKLFEYLKKTFSAANAEFIKDDILLYGKNRSIKKPPSYHIVANLPYAISSHFINVFLTQVAVRPQTMTLMLQKEVGEKITAVKGEMSKLSVLAQTYAEVKKIFVVDKTNFLPQPKVDSVIIKLSTKKILPSIFPHNEKKYWQLVRVGYSSKRKKLLNNIKNGLHIDHEILSKSFKTLGLSENIRAEDISVKEWVSLVDKLSKNY